VSVGAITIEPDTVSSGVTGGAESGEVTYASEYLDACIPGLLGLGCVSSALPGDTFTVKTGVMFAGATGADASGALAYFDACIPEPLGLNPVLPILY
jgi:hypothetical protein